MKKFLMLFSVTLLGCAISGYEKFYEQYVDISKLQDVETLGEGNEPEIFRSDNFEKDIQHLRSMKYLPIGYSSFNGGYEGRRGLIKQAKKVGALLVLVSSTYTDTRTTTTNFFVPDNKTTYFSGNVYGNTSYSSLTSGYLGSSSTLGSYSGSATTYGTKAIPITTHQDRYDQLAVFFVKINKKFKFGVGVGNLSSEQRFYFQRNTGAVINIVFENSPAFYSNLLVGDIIIQIDGVLVRNANHAIELMNSIPDFQKKSILKIIRNGEERELKVNFNF